MLHTVLSIIFQTGMRGFLNCYDAEKEDVNMKKSIFTITLAAFLLLTAGTVPIKAAAEAPSSAPVTAETILSFYDSVIDSDAWRFGSRKARGEALQLSAEMLGADTAVLAEAVLCYPYLMDVYAFSDIQSGMESLYETFNGLRELAARPDAAEVLWEIYLHDDQKALFNFAPIEILLCQSFVIDRLPEDKLLQFLENISEKYQTQNLLPSCNQLIRKTFYRAAERTAALPELLDRVVSLLPVRIPHLALMRLRVRY